MAIRDNVLNGHFARRPIERQLAAALGECFDITYGNEQQGFSFWLAEPNRATKERFALNQEVLVIYSPHKRTDARTLTTIEDISRNKDFKNRIDRVLILLIHCGDQAATKDLIANQTSWIIVPFSQDELVHARGNLFVRSRISEHAGAADLFGMSSPIRVDKYLFGRDELIQSLSNRLIEKGENAGLFGLRKTGKTSVLFAIERRTADRSRLMKYFDCQNPAHHNSRWWHLLQQIRDSLYESAVALGHPRPKSPPDYTEASGNFSHDMTSLLQIRGLERIVLMLDEIEYITPNISGALGKHWDADFVPFWQSIRAAHQETAGALSFIVAGVNPAGIEQTHFGTAPNPIFQLATPHFLEPLSPASVREMVRTVGKYTGLSFDEDTYAYLQAQYGGHPYLIRLACSEIWANVDTRQMEQRVAVSRAMFEALHDKIVERIARPLKDILLSLVWWYPDDYDLLCLAASGDNSFVRDYLKDSDTRAVLFTRYGLLDAATGAFVIPDLRDFLNEHGRVYEREISPFRRSDVPPDVLPDVPDIELLGRLFQKKCALEVQLRTLIVTYLGVRYNWNQVEIAKAIASALTRRNDRKDPMDTFVGRSLKDAMNDVYTRDLKDIIDRHWQMFSGIFDENRQRFDMNMDAVNKARRYDGHVKVITAKEVENFENSYNWFERCLARVKML